MAYSWAQSRRAFSTILPIALVASSVAMQASATQPPRKVMTIAQTCKLQASATEILTLRFKEKQSLGPVMTSKLTGPALLPEANVYVAEILGTHRSRSGLWVGQTITINDFAGPGGSPVGQIENGTIVATVFLARLNSGAFRFAALDKSLKPIAPALCHDSDPESRELAAHLPAAGRHPHEH